MRFPHFFIERPIFAAVLAVLIVLVGLIAYPSLPVAQYPEIAPPTVVVSASYPGASAETLAETVATPLEESINGVENMLYMSSSSTGDGNVFITVTFRQGANIDQSQVLVQNRVSTAEPRLPDEVRQIGVTVRKSSPDLLMVATLTSPDGSLSHCAAGVTTTCGSGSTPIAQPSLASLSTKSPQQCARKMPRSRPVQWASRRSIGAAPPSNTAFRSRDA